jgi:hypothetical protein
MNLKKYFSVYLKKTNWGRDIINFLYMLEHLGYIRISLKKKWKD